MASLCRQTYTVQLFVSGSLLQEPDVAMTVNALTEQFAVQQAMRFHQLEYVETAYIATDTQEGWLQEVSLVAGQLVYCGAVSQPRFVA